MRAIELRTEYLKEPLGLDNRHPRFYWKCENGIKQTAYCISAKKADEVVWDTGKIYSDRMTHIPYEGPPLKSRDRIAWSVSLWDEQDRKGEAVTSWFEMGLLDEHDWEAHWISGNYTPRKNERYPVDCFKKTFRLQKDIKKARLYMTACGLYEATINGRRVGNFELAPGCTDYRYRIQYQSYDVTELLGSENTLEMQLADGWYRGSIGCFGPTNVFGKQTKLLCQLEVEFEDGTHEKIISDDSFSWSNDGAIRFADLKDGEVVDASFTPSYQGTAALVKEKLVPTASNNVDIKQQEHFTPKLILTPSGKKVLDFGQNIAGFLSFRIKGDKGQRIKLRLGEILDEDGEFTQKNFQKLKPAKEFGAVKKLLLITGNESKIPGELAATPKQEIECVCSGGEDEYRTRFAIFGFRYAEVETDIRIEPEQFTAIAVYSDMEETGSFSCSNEKVNRFLENTRWSMKGNFADIPTDCPTRERLGWTGDGQVFFHTAAFLMNIAPFYRKWLHDFADGQFKNGKNAAVIPYVGMDMVYNNTGGSVGWADAVVLIPYRFWKWYGDKEIIETFYPQMARYAQFMIKNTGMKNKKMAKDNPFDQYTYEKGFHLGEWLEPEEFRSSPRERTLHTEICTAYLHETMKCMSEIAAAIGKEEDTVIFREYAKGAKAAYEWLFLQNKSFDTNRQAVLVRPLAFGLAEGEKREEIATALVSAVKNRDYRVGTGFLSTPFLLEALSNNGYTDIAYKMLENEKAPSWLAEVNAGATTVWEDWEGKESHNHYSPGAVCEWLFHTVGGIEVSGENHFKIKPQPGGTLEYATASYNSLYGLAATSWKKGTEGYQLEVTIPANTTAEICLPNHMPETVTAGTYQYTFDKGE